MVRDHSSPYDKRILVNIGASRRFPEAALSVWADEGSFDYARLQRASLRMTMIDEVRSSDSTGCVTKETQLSCVSTGGLIGSKFPEAALCALADEDPSTTPAFSGLRSG
jgi:hypothetical protein